MTTSSHLWFAIDPQGQLSPLGPCSDRQEAQTKAPKAVLLLDQGTARRWFDELERDLPLTQEEERDRQLLQSLKALARSISTPSTL